MLLSVFTPVLNCRSTIEKTAISVIKLSEFLPNQIEWLVGDGGSNDGTYQYFSHLIKSHPWIKIYSLPNFNIPSTLNSLNEHANGNYFTVLNGDDWILPEVFLSFIQLLQSDKYKNVVSGYVRMIDSEGSVAGVREADGRYINQYMSVNHPGMVAVRELLIRTPFEECYPTAYDYLWTWRLAKNGTKIYVIAEVVAVMMMGGISATRSNQAAKEIFSYKLKNGHLISPILNYLKFLIKKNIKKILIGVSGNKIINWYRINTGSIDKYEDTIR